MTDWHRITAARAWELFDRLGRAHALVSHAVGARTEGNTPSAAGIAALSLLEESGGMTQTEWGRQQGVSRQRAHVVARELEGQGLIGISRSGRDSALSLTAAGKRALKKERRRIGDACVEALRDVDPAEAESLHALLGQVLEGLGGASS